MLSIEIPGFGPIKLEHLVSDFTGTLSVGGKLVPGVEGRLNKISDFMEIHILTADTFGAAKDELKNVKCTIHILTGESHDLQKEKYVRGIGPDRVVSLGNGNNDRKMLKASKVGIAVTEGEGCAVDAIISANIVVKSALDALDLLLEPKKMKATLRF